MMKKLVLIGEFFVLYVLAILCVAKYNVVLAIKAALLTVLVGLVAGTLARFLARRPGWWIWEQITISDPEEKDKADNKGSASKRNTFQHYRLLYLIEIYQVPEEHWWVVRSAFRGKGNAVKYRAFSTGWAWIWFPEVLMKSVKVVDGRTRSADPRSMVVNTTMNPVKADVSYTWKVAFPIRFVTQLGEKVETIIEQLVSAAINVATAGYDDEHLIKSSDAEVNALQDEVTEILNGAKDLTEYAAFGDADKGLEGDPILDLKSLGLRVKVRLQNVKPMEEIADALASVTASKFRAEEAKNRAHEIETIREALGYEKGGTGMALIHILETANRIFQDIGRSGFVNIGSHNVTGGGGEKKNDEPAKGDKGGGDKGDGKGKK